MPERNHASMEDHFADALDAMTLDLPPGVNGTEALAEAARTIQGIGAKIAIGSGTMTTPRLDRATKSRIWADLMREHGGAANRTATPQVPGTSGGALPLNPWQAKPASAPTKRPRPSSSVLRFVPAAQPTSSFLLVLAVIVLIGATFASLSPNGGQGVFPTAFATEDPAQLAFASPKASPEPGGAFLQPITLGDCTVDSRPLEEIRALQEEPGETIVAGYVPVEAADPALAVEIAEAARTWRACAAYGYPSQRLALESPRRIFEFGGNATPDLAAWDQAAFEEHEAALAQLAATVLDGDWASYHVETATMGDYADGTAVYTMQDQRSFILPEHVYALPDGRVGGLVTQLVPLGHVEATSAYPDRSVEFQIFVQDPTQDGRWVLDESIWLCAAGCDLPLHESAPGTPDATPQASLPSNGRILPLRSALGQHRLGPQPYAVFIW